MQGSRWSKGWVSYRTLRAAWDFESTKFVTTSWSFPNRFTSWELSIQINEPQGPFWFTRALPASPNDSGMFSEEKKKHFNSQTWWMIQRKWHLPDTIGLICMKLQRLWQYSKTCINSRLTKIPEWKREGEVDKSPTPFQEATCNWYLLREIHLFYSIAETLGISATLQLGLILRSFVVVYFFFFLRERTSLVVRKELYVTREGKIWSIYMMWNFKY